MKWNLFEDARAIAHSGSPVKGSAPRSARAGSDDGTSSGGLITYLAKSGLPVTSPDPAALPAVTLNQRLFSKVTPIMVTELLPPAADHAPILLDTTISEFVPMAAASNLSRMLEDPEMP